MRKRWAVSAHLGVVTHEGDAVARIARARAAVARVNTHPGPSEVRGDEKSDGLDAPVRSEVWWRGGI